MSTSSKSLLEPLRVRVRRFQFVAGLGFLSLVMGSMISVSLTLRFGPRIQDIPFTALRLLFAFGIEHLWLLAVLPLLSYGASRIIDLRPMSTALGGALTGMLFVFSLDYVRDGLDGLLGDDWLHPVLRLVAVVLGGFISHRAVARGRAEALQGQALAEQEAKARKVEYDAFLRVAEGSGEKGAQQEDSPAPAAAEAPAAAGGTEGR